MRTVALVLLFACGTPMPEDAGDDGVGPPAARIEVVTDTYHGTEVADPYRWLEDGDSAEVKAWSAAQSANAHEVLDGLPEREQLRDELAAILGATRRSHFPLAFAGGRVFAERHAPPKQRGVLVVMDDGPSLDGRVLLDPEQLDPTGLTSIDWFVPSPDGTRVAVSLSSGGTESGDVHVLDAATGDEVDAVLPRVNGGTAGGALAWEADGSGFWYTRYPREGERDAADMDFYVQLWHHTLGNLEDTYEIGKDFPRIAEIDLEAHHGTGRLLATVQDGDGGEFSHHVREPDGTWRTVSTFGDRTVMATFAEDGSALWTVSFADAPHGEVGRAPIGAATLVDAPVVIPQGDDTVVTSFWEPPSVRELGGVLYVTYQTGGPSELRAFTVAGKPTTGPAQEPVSTVGTMVPGPDGTLVLSVGSFVREWTWYAWNAREGTTTTLELSDPPVVDLSDVEVRRELATSKDGTKVPVNVLVPPEARPGGPCIVGGYGGYGISLGPRFDAAGAPVLRRGVVTAVVNTRGGGEFGEDWHLQGNLTRKQNVFDDFYAGIQHLVSTGVCAADRVGIIGGSNGGLLMGATFVQHPGDIAAVVSAVGIYDMLRVELSPNGAFNVTEFGTVTDADQFRALYAYSPYHHVEDGTAYPPILFTTGANDPRVDPMQSRKMTARLQAAGAATLLRVNENAGHGAGKLDDKIDLEADQLAFLLSHLGVTRPTSAPAIP